MADPWYGASDYGHSTKMSAMAEFSCQNYRQRSQDSCPKFGYRRPQITTHQSDYRHFQKAEIPLSKFTGPQTKELIVKRLARTGGKGPWRHFQETVGVRGENVQWIDGSRKLFDQMMIENLPSSLEQRLQSSVSPPFDQLSHRPKPTEPLRTGHLHDVLQGTTPRPKPLAQGDIRKKGILIFVTPKKLKISTKIVYM